MEKNSMAVNSRMEANSKSIYATGLVEVTTAVSNRKVSIYPLAKGRLLHSAFVMGEQKRRIRKFDNAVRLLRYFLFS